MSLVRFLTSYQRIQQSLQWWSSRQSMKLFVEAEKIRDDLLQESFTIRRNLDLLRVDHLNLSDKKIQECLKQIDNFHHSLVQLSDRLFPASLQDSFPLAIECLLEPWLVSNPQLYFQIDLPLYWRHEPAERSLVVLTALNELLTITLAEVLASTSIYINLKEHKNIGQLIVEITYPNVSTFIFHSRLPELNYLCETFRLLTSGKCFRRAKNMKISWYFYW
ncbi:hypothetical protein IQ276_001495 [Desmonostoc muscorum LEGE 12446]|uniref:Uncharacterized protein n=1 Tax=Desmonostoc muscorum LEGE 12446 TaxID=1828758 RepID=A0A8J7AFQ7_DESMC|nr:hypothetical protein [Desmonostoc muscorum]MCF2145146.1 hypothetical protein [Desmonostoc muscorum LEGE 12446]